MSALVTEGGWLSILIIFRVVLSPKTEGQLTQHSICKYEQDIAQEN